MAVNSHLRSSTILFLGAGASAPLGKMMMGDFVTHLSTIQEIGVSNLFQAITTKERDLEFLLEELGDIESKAYMDDVRSDPSGGARSRLFQSLATQAFSLRKRIEREVFLHYRSFETNALSTLRSHLLPLIEATSKVLDAAEPLVIFTTNYDPAVEEFVRQAPRAYALFDGFEFNSTLGEIIWTPNAFANWKPSNIGHRNVLLIKLHGSTNWVKHNGRIAKLPGPGHMATDDNTISNVLIYPAQDKVAANDPFFTAYYLFQHFLKSAKRLLAVGYSFRDLDASTRLRTAMIDNEQLQVALVDPNAENIRERLAKQFIRAVAIPGSYDPINSHPQLPSSPRGNVIPKIEAFLSERMSAGRSS